MTAFTRLHLLAPAGTSAQCLTLDDSGRIIAREQWSLDPPVHCLPARPDTPVREVLAVPGAAVGSTWLAIEAASEAQAVALARHRLEGRHASAAGALHVVLAPAVAGAPERQALVVDAALMQRWLDTARAVGIEADAMLPDYMLLPSPIGAGGDRLAPAGDAITILERAGQWLVRGDRLAFTAEPELARLLLEDRQGEPFAPVPDASDARLAAGAMQASVNLLQHRFVPRRADSGPPPLRRMALLAALLVASPALLAAGDALRHGIAASRLEREATDTARDLLGASAADLPPATALQDALDAGTPGTIPLAPLFAAVDQVPGLRLERLDAGDGAPVVVCVVPGAPADLEALREGLAHEGLPMTLAPEASAPADCPGRAVLLSPEAER
ncbi:type II secretion system protein GspL [Marilutibacter aestuarii]|nr:type II secretion system protein GspL [Lysobacter aestuarii]